MRALLPAVLLIVASGCAAPARDRELSFRKVERFDHRMGCLPLWRFEDRREPLMEPELRDRR